MWAGMMLWMLVFWVGILVLAFVLASWLFPAVPVAPHPCGPRGPGCPVRTR